MPAERGARGLWLPSLAGEAAGARGRASGRRPKSRRLLACRVQFFFALAVFTSTRAATLLGQVLAPDRLTTRTERVLDIPSSCSAEMRPRDPKPGRPATARKSGLISLSGSRRPKASSGTCSRRRRQTPTSPRFDQARGASALQATSFRGDVTEYRGTRVHDEASHDPEVADSNPAPATTKGAGNGAFRGCFRGRYGAPSARLV